MCIVHAFKHAHLTTPFPCADPVQVENSSGLLRPYSSLKPQELSPVHKLSANDPANLVSRHPTIPKEKKSGVDTAIAKAGQNENWLDQLSAMVVVRE